MSRCWDRGCGGSAPKPSSVSHHHRYPQCFSFPANVSSADTEKLGVSSLNLMESLRLKKTSKIIKSNLSSTESACCAAAPKCLFWTLADKSDAVSIHKCGIFISEFGTRSHTRQFVLSPWGPWQALLRVRAQCSSYEDFPLFLPK